MLYFKNKSRSLRILGFSIIVLLFIQVLALNISSKSYSNVVRVQDISEARVTLDTPDFQSVRIRAKQIIADRKRLADEKLAKELEEARLAKEALEQKQKEEAEKLAKEKAEQVAKEVAAQKLAQEAQKKAKLEAEKTAIATVQISGTKEDWMRQAGIPEADWQYVNFIVTRESTWNPAAVNKSSGACGLAQALPCAKTGCANYADPICSLRWQHGYVKARYGGYKGAYDFWQVKKWY